MDEEDDRCVPLNRKSFRLHPKWDLLQDLMSGAQDDMETYARMQLDAEEYGDTAKADEYKQKFKESKTILALLSNRAEAIYKHGRGDKYTGAPTDPTELEIWLDPTINTLIEETERATSAFAVATLNIAIENSDKDYNRSQWRAHRKLLQFLKSSQKPAPTINIRDEDDDLMPDPHEYAGHDR
jgi:hypothetical protein